MAVLSGKQSERICALIVAAFDKIELARAVLISLDKRLDAIVGVENRGLDAIVFDLVGWADRQGRAQLIELLRGVVTLRPGDRDIWAFCAEVFPGEIQPIESDRLVERISRGLTALVALKHLPVVQLTVGEFRADFDAASKQIQILKRYKSLHDSLHRLQLRIGTIEKVIETAKTQEAAARSLTLHAIELRPMAQKARLQAQGLPGAQNEMAWITNFETCINTMNNASTNPMSAADLDQLADDLEELLTQSSRINALLAHVAAALPLDHLVQAMAKITTHINATTNTEDEAAQRLAADLTALSVLQPQLADRVGQHFEWQWIDKELTAADLFQDPGPAAKMPRRKWPQFKERFEQLCGGHPQDAWSQDLRSRLLLWETLPLSAPPTGKEAEASESAFEEFRSACMMRFFEVDDELNTLCGRLTEVASPLNALLTVIRS